MTQRFFAKLHCILLCLGTADAALALHCHTQIDQILAKLYEDYLKANGTDYAVQLLCDLTAMHHALARVFYLTNKQLPASCLPPDRLDKLTAAYRSTAARLTSLVETVRGVLEPNDFFLFLHTSKHIAEDFYNQQKLDLPLLFPDD